MGNRSTRAAILMCMVFAAAVLGLAVLDPHRPGAGVAVLDHADDVAFTSADGSVLWTGGNVALSQNWNTDTDHAVKSAATPVTGRYELRFDTALSSASASVMVARVSQALLIEINGAVIHDDDGPGALKRWDWYSPVVAEIPDGLLRPHDNVMVLTVTAAPGSVAGLSRVLLGGQAAIEGMAGRLHFLQKPLPTYANVSVFAMSVPLLLIWLHGRGIEGRPFRVYGLLAAASMLFSLRSMHVHAGELSMPYHLWMFLVGASLGWALGFFYAFMLHFVGAGTPRTDRALVLFVAGGTVAMAIIPEARMTELATLVWYVPLAAAGLLCTAVVCHRTVRAPDAGRIALSASLLLLFVAGMHDVAWSRGALTFESLLWMPLVMPAVLLAILASIANRFVAAWMSADMLGRNLAARVREAEEEIAASYDERLEAQRREMLAAERAKLVEDLHDGVGSRLSVLLATLQASALPRERTIRVLRDCLSELRMLITARDRGTLGEALAELCGQLGDLLEQQGVELQLRIDPLAEELRMAPREMLNLMRIVQEACANAARHARGDWVRVECGFAAPGRLRIVVSDGGKGRRRPRSAPESSGRGLATMRARAARMGAGLAVDRQAAGWRVTLDLPVAGASPGGAEAQAAQGRLPVARSAGRGIRETERGVAVK